MIFLICIQGCVILENQISEKKKELKKIKKDLKESIKIYKKN